MRIDHRMTDRRNQSRAALARDAALARVGRTRRWIIAGSAALTAGIAALVSAAAPGRTLSPSSHVQTEASTAGSPSRATASSAIPKLPALAKPGALGLQGPGQAPQSVPNQSQSQSQSQSQPQSQPQPQAPPAAPSTSSSGSGGGGGPVVSGGS